MDKDDLIFEFHYWYDRLVKGSYKTANSNRAKVFLIADLLYKYFDYIVPEVAGYRADLDA